MLIIWKWAKKARTLLEIFMQSMYWGRLIQFKEEVKEFKKDF